MTKAVDDRRRGRARESAPKKSLKGYAPSPPVVAAAAAEAERASLPPGVSTDPDAILAAVNAELAPARCALRDAFAASGPGAHGVVRDSDGREHYVGSGVGTWASDRSGFVITDAVIEPPATTAEVYQRYAGEGGRSENERLVDRLGDRLQQALSSAGYDFRIAQYRREDLSTKRSDLDRDARHAHSKMVADAIVQGFGLLSCAVLIGTILVLAVQQ